MGLALVDGIKSEASVAAMALGGSSAIFPMGEGGRQPVASVRAGRCLLSGTLVSPDPRKGTLQLIQLQEGLSVRWLLRPSGEKMDEFILGRDATLQLLPNPKARVIAFKASNGTVTKIFF
ncbi:nucleolar protein family [Cyclospora cayetanensis]|uniref:Nucleolar protein family n=1 Tax=Cyclospora cayetanensis TaxID=88456 RepID=A0A1D3DAT5_9EIME|nr:nucleolar protein family [Cyclospora cayetanensis]